MFIETSLVQPRAGPFDKINASPTATYPSLWNHNAKKETRIICEPDSQLRARQGMETKAAQVWTTASRAHVNLELRFNSQPLAVAFTERESIGGRAWPNVIFDDDRFDYAFAVWGNSTLGLLSYWWHSSLQDSGRGVITIRSAETLPTLDLRALTARPANRRPSHLRRLPGTRANARLPSRRRPQPRPPRPPRNPRVARHGRQRLRSNAPLIRQVVRRTLRAWGEA